jgi:hypothetical protein
MSFYGVQFGEEQAELLAFSHEPNRTPRPDVIGEVVMAEMWQAHMRREANDPQDDCDEYAFRALMNAFPFALTQRHATVAASFVKWLGTNCGRCFLSTAARISAKLDGAMDAYAAAWAMENTRHIGINGGYRTIEAVLATDANYENGRLTHMPDVSAHDCEVIDHVVTWLGMRDGQAFVAACEKEITARLDAQREERMRKFYAPKPKNRDLYR